MEQNIKCCKNCGVNKQHILDTKYDYKNKKYVDETGGQWNGKTCPSCHNNNMRIHMKSKRTVVKVD
jgi:hypothetical protein